MRLFRLEIKRILKSRRTLIILAIALLLSVAMAYLPISFEGINRPNEDGTVTELNGLAAIKYKQDLYKTSAGEVTPDRIKSALETYQSCVREYGPVEEEGFPLAVYIEKIVPLPCWWNVPDRSAISRKKSISMWNWIVMEFRL